MTLHATARARAIVHTAAIVGVLVIAGTGALLVSHLGEARRCHHLTSKAAAARYGCPTTSGVVTQGEGVVTPEATPTPRVMAPRRAPVASRTRRLDPSSSGSQLDVTCYAPTGNRTASGKWPRIGMAASNSHPFGTRLLVEGIGVLTVEDRIGHGTDLDVFRTSEAECIRFGRQHLLVAVVR
jgi:3D (Asp-Asp-Asp) domain-containing protein